jgi:hypothetical protein
LFLWAGRMIVLFVQGEILFRHRVGRGLRRARREARIVATQDLGVRRTIYPESWLSACDVGSVVIRLDPNALNSRHPGSSLWNLI